MSSQPRQEGNVTGLNWMENKTRIADAIARTSAWSDSLVTAQGFRGCSNSLQAHYKAPYCMSKVGNVVGAVCIMRHLLSRFANDGRFDRDVVKPRAWVSGTYSNAWVAAGAFQLGLHDIAAGALDAIERSIHPEIGAPPNLPAVQDDATFYDAGSVSRAIESFLNAGRVEPAVRLGLFLKTMFDTQPVDAKVVTWARDAKGALFSPANPAHNKPTLMIELGANRQCYWFLGFTIRCFARLYRIDHWQGWLDTAHRILGWLDRCAPDKTANITNAKLGWGTAEMYAVTGDDQWSSYAVRVVDWLVTHQTPQGVWVRPEFNSEAEQPTEVSMDTAIERMYYLQEMTRALAWRDLS
jgi:hypothetical protein